MKFTFEVLPVISDLRSLRLPMISDTALHEAVYDLRSLRFSDTSLRSLLLISGEVYVCL